MPTQVRPAAIADEGWRFVVADVAQLEPRVLAAMSGDTAMAGAARGADLYQGIVAAGVVATRAEAKVGMLGALYGATRGESGRMMPRLTRALPARHRAGRGGRAGGGARARSCAPCSAAARRCPAARGRRSGATSARPPTTRTAARARTATGSGAPGAGSPATSSSRAPPPSGRCAGWPTCATGCGSSGGGGAARAPAPGVLPARRGGRAHPRAPGGRGRRGGAAGRGRGGPAAVRRASRSTSRSTSPSSGRGPTREGAGRRGGVVGAPAGRGRPARRVG